MSHECDDCGQQFETLTRLRLHDCSSMTESEGATLDSSDTDNRTPSGGTNRSPESAETASLDAFLDDGANGEMDSLTEAMATYESELQSASESGMSDRYSDIRNGYRRPLIGELDKETQVEGWTVLDELIGTYHPNTAEGVPHVTTILQNVIGRNFIRTRLTDGVEAIPVVALEYLETIRSQVGEHQDFIIEGLHPYGWGIGHPDLAVAERIRDHASAHIFSTSPMLEHAFYADQHMATDLLERMVHDDAVQHEITYRLDETITGARWLLDAPAGAASGQFWPTMPRYWDWHDDLAFDFGLEDDIEHRIRNLVREEGLEDDLPQDWEITDLTL